MANTDPNMPVDSNPASSEVDPYCNSYTSNQDDLNLSTGALACVNVGGTAIGDFIFQDWNGNGVQDAGEDGIPGVGSLRHQRHRYLYCDTTDADGKYLINGLTDGTYIVNVNTNNGVPTGYTLTGDPDGPTSPSTMWFTDLANDEEEFGADWGYKPGGSGEIGDLVFEDIGNDGHTTL